MRLAEWLGILLAALAAAGLPGEALALINPRFTPADLVRSSKQILLLKVSAPRSARLEADVAATLKGAAFPVKQLVLDLARAEELTDEDVLNAFGGGRTAAAVLFLAKDRPGGRGERIAGVIQINTTWFAVFADKGKWRLDADKRDMLSVWAGSARMLAEATRYVQADPAAEFPVRSLLHWGADLHLGKLRGRANACITADLGEPVGLCVLVLSDGGDRIYQAGRGGKPPTDVTERLKLTTASKAAAPGDFNADGRMDLACWDGKRLTLAVRGPEGTFAGRSVQASLPDCHSLTCVDAGLRPGAAGPPVAPGMLAGTSRGPVLLVPGDGGLHPGGLHPPYAARPLAAGSDNAPTGLGPGGICVAADFDRDGLCDVLQLFTKGTMFYAGTGPGRFRTPVKTPDPLVGSPRVAVCGDYNADGFLDLVVGGASGLALLEIRGRDPGSPGRRNLAKGVSRPRITLENATHATGELVYHGNANQPRVVAGAPCDVNQDGRQGVVLFYAGANPMAFFNRGFGCFGLARELALQDTKLKGGLALQRGAAAGTMLDVNGDGAEDLFAVDPAGDVWVLFGKLKESVRLRLEDRRDLSLVVALPPKARGPVTVGVSNERRRIGTHVVAPGVPAFIRRPEPETITLEWTDPRGKKQTRKVAVEGPTRAELTPAAPPAPSP